MRLRPGKAMHLGCSIGLAVGSVADGGLWVMLPPLSAAG
jgi:hypothetical protein